MSLALWSESCTEIVAKTVDQKREPPRKDTSNGGDANEARGYRSRLTANGSGTQHSPRRHLEPKPRELKSGQNTSKGAPTRSRAMFDEPDQPDQRYTAPEKVTRSRPEEKRGGSKENGQKGERVTEVGTQPLDYVDCDRTSSPGVGLGRESGKTNFHYSACQASPRSQEILGGKVVTDIS